MGDNNINNININNNSNGDHNVDSEQHCPRKKQRRAVTTTTTTTCTTPTRPEYSLIECIGSPYKEYLFPIDDTDDNDKKRRGRRSKTTTAITTTTLQTIFGLCKSNDDDDDDRPCLYWTSPSKACFRTRRKTMESTTNDNDNNDDYNNLPSNYAYCSLDFLLSLKQQQQQQSANRHNYDDITIDTTTICNDLYNKKYYTIDVIYSTLIDAAKCLVFLLSLPDHNNDNNKNNNNNNNVRERFVVERVTIRSQQRQRNSSNNNNNTLDDAVVPPALPMGESHLKSVLSHQHQHHRYINRQYKFVKWTFYSFQSWVLATVGTNTNFWFSYCRFQDNQECGQFFQSFLKLKVLNKKTLVSTTKGTTSSTDKAKITGTTKEGYHHFLQGPSRLIFEQRFIPCRASLWVQFLQSDQLIGRYLGLIGLPFDDDLWQAMVTTKATSLSIANISRTSSTTSTSTTRILIQAIRDKKSPRCLEVDPTALGGTVQNNTIAVFQCIGDDVDGHIQKLAITRGNDGGTVGIEAMPSLLDALQRNLGLEEFSCILPRVEEEEDEEDDHDNPNIVLFRDLCVAVANHPKIFKCSIIPATTTTSTATTMSQQNKVVYTKILAKSLASNQNMESMPFHDDVFDHKIWKGNIQPRLACNRYRKKLQLFHQQYSYHHLLRDVTMTTAMATVSSDPSRIWMLLTSNVELVANCLSKRKK